MRRHSDNSEVCPNCGRHCTADNLHCPRGEAYFGLKTSKPLIPNGRPQDRIRDETVMLMLECGHTLHHGLMEQAENEDILQFLSPDEKNELTLILKKCVNAWDNK